MFVVHVFLVISDEARAYYTGYIDAGARHLFCYFFENRNDSGALD